MSSRLRRHCPSQPVAQQHVPVYAPPCCPPLTNRDPRRHSPYCPPTRSFSEPLSHAEYLRRLKENNTAPISSTNSLVQYGEGEYKKTLWMEGLVGGACCPAVPLVPAAQTTQDAGLYTESKGAAAAAIVGINDKKGVPESLHTLQKHGQAIFSQKCPGVSCEETFPVPPPPPPVINFSYLAIQRASGNFIYNIYNTITNNWTYSSDSGYDSSYTFVEAGFVGDKFYTVFNQTSTNTRFFHIIDLYAVIKQQFTTSISDFGFNSGYTFSPVLGIFVEAVALNQINIRRYDPVSDTISSSGTIAVSSYANYFNTLFYDLVFIRYRSSESPVTVNHILWPITQTTAPLPVYITPFSPGIFLNISSLASYTGNIANNTHFTFKNDGTYLIPTISGTNVTGLSIINISGFSPTSIGRRIFIITRGGWNEFYMYNYDIAPIGFININPIRRMSSISGASSLFLIQNTYETGLISRPSNSSVISEQNVINYTNAISSTNIITAGNYTDISGSVVGGRTFALSRIAYNTYYQESTFGYITGNSDNPVTTLLYMTNGSTWIQGSGTVSATRTGTMTVTNSTGSYSINKFFTVETMIPILEPNDSIIDLPVSSNTTSQRAWNVVQQQLMNTYANTGNSVINQGTYSMIIRPKNTTSVVRQIEFRAGNLSPRDPTTFTLEGSNDNGVTYTTIVSSSATNISSDSFLGSRYFTYYSPVFANSSAYSQYRLTFPTLRSGTDLQLQKVQFLAEAPAGYLMDGAVNASVTLNQNQTYHFKVNAPNDIFWIQTVPAPYSPANVYNTGVTNNGCKSSILTFAVPVGAPATLYYVSQTDPTKTGTINIVNSGAPGGNISGSWWAHINSSSSPGINSYADVWFSVENATQWGTSGVSIVQDTRPSSAPAAGASYQYVMGASGQNYLFGKMFLISPTTSIYSGSEIQSILQQYILNLNLFNTFSSISYPKLYSHITPTIAYSLPSWATSVMTVPNGLSSTFQDRCITFNLTAYNDIIIRRIATGVVSNGPQQFDIYYRIGGVQHSPPSAPTISAANGWTQITTTNTPIQLSQINTNIRAINFGFSINVTAGQTLGFCIRSSTNVVFQSNTVGSNTQFFENNDFRVTIGDNAGYSGNAGPAMPFTLTNTPFTFAGLIEAERTVSPAVYERSSLSTLTFTNTLKYGDIYSILGTENTVRTFNYTIPNLFVNNITMIRFNNAEYIAIPETTQYALNLRIVRAVGSGDLVVPIRTNLVCLPSTFTGSIFVFRLLGYFAIFSQFNGVQNEFAFVRVTDGTIVASGFSPGTIPSVVISDSKAIILNSDNTVTMFRNGILESYTANTFTNIASMRSDQETGNTLFAYSTARVLALTDSGYNVVTFPTPLTIINSTILANNYLTLIQLNPLRIYAIDSSATLYTYSLAQSTTLMRRRNTETSMLVHVTYPSASPGPNSTTYILRMTDQFGDGWDGNGRMELRQGATVIQTIGSTFISGFGPVDVSVTLTAGLSYSLVWTAGGANPSEIGVQILNPSGGSVYQMPFGSQVLVGTTLTTFTAQSLPSVISENLFITFDTITKQFYTNTATTNTVSNVVGNFIYQPV